ISDFLAKLRLYLQNQRVNPADNAGGPPTGREVAIGYLRGWQANLVAVNRRTAVQIGNQALNKAFGQPGGHPTNIAVNVPNANNDTTVVQAVAQKAQAPALQIVEPVRQPRGSPSSLQTKKGIENYNLTQYLHNLDIFSTEDFDRNFSIKPFQKPYPGQLYSSIKMLE
ncbi:5379_t:CDS:2, partial [Cetraspora pellucida]